MQSAPTVTQYTQGTVIVDVFDPKTKELLWRGQGVAAVSDNEQQYEQELKKTVEAIVDKFPARRTRSRWRSEARDWTPCRGGLTDDASECGDPDRQTRHGRGAEERLSRIHTRCWRGCGTRAPLSSVEMEALKSHQLVGAQRPRGHDRPTPAKGVPQKETRETHDRTTQDTETLPRRRSARRGCGSPAWASARGPSAAADGASPGATRTTRTRLPPSVTPSSAASTGSIRRPCTGSATPRRSWPRAARRPGQRPAVRVHQGRPRLGRPRPRGATAPRRRSPEHSPRARGVAPPARVERIDLYQMHWPPRTARRSRTTGARCCSSRRGESARRRPLQSRRGAARRRPSGSGTWTRCSRRFPRSAGGRGAELRGVPRTAPGSSCTARCSRDCSRARSASRAQPGSTRVTGAPRLRLTGLGCAAISRWRTRCGRSRSGTARRLRGGSSLDARLARRERRDRRRAVSRAGGRLDWRGGARADRRGPG